MMNIDCLIDVYIINIYMQIIASDYLFFIMNCFDCVNLFTTTYITIIPNFIGKHQLLRKI